MEIWAVDWERSKWDFDRIICEGNDAFSAEMEAAMWAIDLENQGCTVKVLRLGMP